MVTVLKIAVCDDQQQNLEVVKNIWKAALPTQFQYEYVEFDCAETLLQCYKNGEGYDLLVLDIEMGEISGMEAAKRIRRIDKDVKIIFVTAYDQYMREAFDVSALYYLEKPVDVTKLAKLFRTCIQDYQEQNYVIYFTMINQKGQIEKNKLSIHEILYIESYMRNVIIHTTDSQTYTIKGKLSDYERELYSRNFIRTHMSYLVNMRYVASINREAVKLKIGQDRKEIPLSRKQKTLVEEAFLDYKVGAYQYDGSCN